MAAWFAKLMQKGRTRSSSPHDDAGRKPGVRDARYDAIVQALRDRELEDRRAREQRQRWYRQHLKSDPAIASSVPDPVGSVRLHRFRTKVPCRVTAEARTLLDQLTHRFPGATITFPRGTSGQQVVMLAGGASAEP